VKKKKVEFKKKLAVFATVFIVISFVVSAVLSAYDKSPLESLISVVDAAAFAYLVSYAASSTLEKHSRNKYHIREDGTPYTEPPNQVSDTSQQNTDPQPTSTDDSSAAG